MTAVIETRRQRSGGHPATRKSRTRQERGPEWQRRRAAQQKKETTCEVAAAADNGLQRLRPATVEVVATDEGLIPACSFVSRLRQRR